MFKKWLMGSAAFLCAATLIAADGGRAYLGMFGENPADDSKQTGAIVREVVKDGPADKAGLKAGDRIIQLEDQEIKSFEDLQVRMGAFHAGQTVKVVVDRDGKEETIAIELGDRPTEPPASEARRPQFGQAFRGPFNGVLPQELQKQLEEAMRSAMPQNADMTPRPMIGVQLQAMDEDLAKKLGLEETKGVLVMTVSPDGPAAKAGIEADDVIVEADGKAIAAPEDLKNLVDGKKEGDKMNLKVRRGEETLEKTVDIAIGPVGLPPGAFFREFRSEPQAGGEMFGDIRERLQEMQDRVEEMTKERLGDFQKKLESLQADSEKEIEGAKKRIDDLERRLEEMSKKVEKNSEENPKE